MVSFIRLLSTSPDFVCTFHLMKFDGHFFFRLEHPRASWYSEALEMLGILKVSENCSHVAIRSGITMGSAARTEWQKHATLIWLRCHQVITADYSRLCNFEALRILRILGSCTSHSMLNQACAHSTAHWNCTSFTKMCAPGVDVSAKFIQASIVKVVILCRDHRSKHFVV